MIRVGTLNYNGSYWVFFYQPFHNCQHYCIVNINKENVGIGVIKNIHNVFN